ncbi:MerR family transcriptional regulator [Cupriavidus basilensis]
MRIGELARHSSCDVETIRYEREGLDAPQREDSGYRRYGDSHLLQLNFVRHCRSLGMSLSDVRRLRDFERDPTLACDDINALLDRQIEQIHTQRVALEAWRANCGRCATPATSPIRPASAASCRTCSRPRPAPPAMPSACRGSRLGLRPGAELCRLCYDSSTCRAPSW